MEEGYTECKRFGSKGNSRVTITTLILVGSLLFGFILFTLFFPPLHPQDELERKKRFLEYDDDICRKEEIKITKKPGILASPNYPQEYPSDSRCSWLLVAEPNDKIRIFISEIEIEPSVDCVTDYVAVYDGKTAESPLIGRFCGKPDDKDILSSSNALLIMFISDEAYEEKGFQLEYSVQLKNSCNGTVIVDKDNSDGLIVSPNYPNYYPDDVDCWTHLQTADKSGQIIFTFTVLDLEISEGCEFDFIDIYDGDEESNSERIGRYCHDLPSLPVVSKENQLLIHFHADQLLTGKGFVLTYSLLEDFLPQMNTDIGECVWKMDKLNGTITSPNYPRYYGDNQECSFILEAPFAHRIKLTFEDISLASNFECEQDHIEIYDGDSLDSPIKGIFCNDDDKARTVVSKGTKLYVKFMTDDETTSTGFKARYVVVAGTNIYDDEDKDDGNWETGSSCNDLTCNEIPHQVTMTTRPENVSLANGERHVISCTSNNSNDIIIWFKDLTLLASGDQSITGIGRFPNGTVIIKSMNWKLQGVYTCVVLSSGGIETASAWITLKKPLTTKNTCDIKFDLTPTKTALLEGDFDFLRCAAINAEVTWFRDGSPLVHINPSPRIKTPLPGLLLINNAQSEDSGNYTCVAKHNEANCTLSKEFNIFVSTRPPMSCGHPKHEPILSKERIVGGYISHRGSIPWQAMLWETDADTFCGGTLIDSEWVVTAAHCQELFESNYGRKLQYKNLAIKFGKKNRLQTETGEFTSSVDKVIVHPDYNSHTFDNDIALILLKRKVIRNDFIQPLCLADSKFLTNQVYERIVLGTVSGWGLLAEGGVKPRDLREVRLPTVDHGICQQSMERKITKNMFCAGYSQGTSRDACQGDSGGPFAVKIRHNWYLAGIVSWGMGCGRQGKYGVYTKVGNYYDWIRNTIQAHRVSENA